MADAALPTFLRSVYAIQAIPDAAPGREPLTNIPADVLRGVQLHAIVPSRTPVDNDSIPLILRLHSRSEDADTHDRLWVLRFEADVMQVEKFQYVRPFMSCMFSMSRAVSQHVARWGSIPFCEACWTAAHFPSPTGTFCPRLV